MNTTNVVGPREDWIARLTDIAYQTVLARGYRGSFLDLELSLWRQIRQVVELSWPAEADDR